jgi:hypothetical protein
MNKGEPAELARLPAFTTKSIWNAPSAVTLLQQGIAFMRGEFNIPVGYRGSVASGLASWRAKPTAHRRLAPHAPEVIQSAALLLLVAAKYDR